MMKLSKTQIRVVRGQYNAGGKFWYHIEIQSDRRVIERKIFSRPIIRIPWWEPYIINKVTKSTSYFLRSIHPTDINAVKQFGEDALNRINNLNNGDLIVDRKTYYDYVDQLRSEKRGPQYTYL